MYLSWQQRIFGSNTVLWVVYSLAAVIVSAQRLYLSPLSNGYTAYENYVIFKNAFSHFIHRLNPYGAFPAEQWDLFKYSPAFALAMGPFAMLPDFMGLSLWNLANSLFLLAVLLKLPTLTDSQRRFIAWFVLPELIISLQNSQSNGLTAAALLAAWIYWERGQLAAATGYTMAGGFIKIFGIFAALPGLALYSARGKALVYLTGWTLVFALLPMVVTGPVHLIQVYGWWWELLSSDLDASTGLSVLGWLHTWFGWYPSKTAVTLFGMAALFAVLLASSEQPSERVRAWVWASLLLWVVIFNHKAESPTFVIALCGAGIWYVTSNRRWPETLLLIILFALASLSPSDLFPKTIRQQIIQPYLLKAVPCIVLWVLLTFRLLQYRLWKT